MFDSHRPRRCRRSWPSGKETAEAMNEVKLEQGVVTLPLTHTPSTAEVADKAGKWWLVRSERREVRNTNCKTKSLNAG